MLKIYGCSDDLVEVDGTNTKYDEIDCYEQKVFITFQDDTKIKVYYAKPKMAVWGIEVLNKGTANQELQICNDEDADIYSDIFQIDSKIVKVTKAKRGGE